MAVLRISGALLACFLLLFLGRPVHGALVGYGIWPYRPACAFACDRALDSYMLSCSAVMDMGSGMSMGSGSGVTTPQCRANDTSWLETLAWCMHTKCSEHDIPTSELESFWEQQSTEDATVAPKWDYSTTLFNITSPPTQVLSTDTDTETLNFTGLVNPASYLSQYNALVAVQRENVVESGYSIAIIVTGFGTPLILTWLAYVPYTSTLLDRVRPYLVWPSLIGTYQIRPLPHFLGNAPTVGQTLYLVMFFILNIVLSAVNYKSMQPHAWYATQSEEILAYVFFRTGTFAFVLAPLVLLFSSRNNVLIWLTNWSHSTYLVLHRWVARLFALQALLHTLLALPLYYPADATEDYWIWGAVATVALMALIIHSGLYLRRLSYEFFLVTHIVLSVIVIVGCWYHIRDWIGLTWGYETWLYAACAVWFFDRLVRVGRILKTGIRRAKVRNLGGGYMRVDIAGIRWSFHPGKHVYTYFPTLDLLRPWENHPFSVVPTALLQSPYYAPGSDDGSPTDGSGFVGARKDDVLTARTSAIRHEHPTVGLTLFIKKATGMTHNLHDCDGLLTLLDGPYSNIKPEDILRCDRLLLIGGGIGITSLVPWVPCHWNIKLCWTVKEAAKCLVKEVGEVLSGIADKDVRVGSRLNATELLAQEVETGWARVGVVVCGPGELCDDVRAAVIAAGKRQAGTTFMLEVDSYSW